ncbi:ubiquinone biosynthesis hydrox [Trichodelitschia bisporula]|uniref:Ubiquinone biosynthesis monooxygenase COQ6, mitochondrial n=1 Tax=Trichodelitschia bisporula TaxID=703511 RepID=A0A6G1I7D8_9PEZI|nr:ubiquinone biosynthesis hydrox [Trichodelitschia bisporula]
MPPRPQWRPKRPIFLRTPCPRHLRFTSTTTGAPELFDVVCVGGGPAGLSLLAGLRSNPSTSHLKLALIEAQDITQPPRPVAPGSYSNRCSSLTPSSAAYLQRIGAWSQLDRSRVQPYTHMRVWDGLSSAAITFDPPSTSPIAYMVENTNLTTALSSLITSLGGVHTFSPARVSHIGHGPTTPTHDLSSWPTLSLSTGATLSARLLIGADGAASPVRSYAGIPSRGWDYGRVGVVASLRLSSDSAPKTAFQRFLTTGPVALLPLPGPYATLVWSTTPERAARLRGLSGEDFGACVDAAFRLGMVDIDYLHTMSRGQVEEVAWRKKHTAYSEADMPASVEAVQDGSVAAFPLKMRHADTYISNRLALVGDAAHTVHPLAGQGLNLGQADVAALVDVISDAVSTGGDIGSTLVLEEYVARRWGANHAMLGVCDKLHKLYSAEWGPLVGLRSLGLRAVDKLGPVKGFLMRQAAGM